MATELLIEQDVGIGPFQIGQSFREVIHLCKDFNCLEQPASIEYSDITPFNAHLLLRSNIRIGDGLFWLLLGFESYTQKLHFLKLYPETPEQNLTLGYCKEDNLIKVGVKDCVGYRSMQNLAHFLKNFKRKSFRLEELRAKQIKILQSYEETAKSHTKFIFKSTAPEEGDGEEFRSVSSVQTNGTESITSEISRADSTQYKLKSVVLLAQTYLNLVPGIPTGNLTLPTYTYNSSNDYLHLSIANKTHLLSTTSSMQEILTMLGPPDNTFYTKSLKKPPSYFLNYRKLGLDIMCSCITHRVVMIVLHNNIPGHAHFGEYDRAFFTLTHALSEVDILDINYHTHWQSLAVEAPSLGDLLSVDVNRHSNSNSFYPFPSSTLVCLSEQCLLEIHENGYMTNVHIATNFSHRKLMNKYTHRRLNLLKQTPKEDDVVPDEQPSISANPFQDSEPVLFDTEYSSKSDAIKFTYKNLPDLEDDFALYSYNPYLEPMAIPFKFQKAQQSDRTNYLLKRIEVSGKTAKVENRVTFEDIPYIPPFLAKTKYNQSNQKEIVPNEISKIPAEEIFTMDPFCANSGVGSEDDVILDTESTQYFPDTASQLNGESDRQSSIHPSNMDVYSTVSSDSKMYSVRSSLFHSVNNPFPNGIDSNSDLQTSIQSNFSTKSTPEMDSDLKALIEGATQEEIDFPQMMKRHEIVVPILSKRYEISNKVLPLWTKGKSQQAINELNLNSCPSLPLSDPKFYSDLLNLFRTKEFNWTLSISDVLLASILDWIEINSQEYQLETACCVIKLIVKRFRVRIIGNDPTRRAMKEQFTAFINTLFHTFTRLEAIITASKNKQIISPNLLQKISECHRDLILFKSKFPTT